jgi:hypothetical protein
VPPSDSAATPEPQPAAVRDAVERFLARARDERSKPQRVVVGYDDTWLRGLSRRWAVTLEGGLPRRRIWRHGWLLRAYQEGTLEDSGKPSLTLTEDGKVIQNAQWDGYCEEVPTWPDRIEREVVGLLDGFWRADAPRE